MWGTLVGAKLPWKAILRLLRGVLMRISSGILEWMQSEWYFLARHVIALMQPVILSIFGRLHGELGSIEVVQYL